MTDELNLCSVADSPGPSCAESVMQNLVITPRQATILKIVLNCAQAEFLNEHCHHDPEKDLIEFEGQPVTAVQTQELRCLLSKLV